MMYVLSKTPLNHFVMAACDLIFTHVLGGIGKNTGLLAVFFGFK
jgi:hypothetical protein